MPTNSLPIIVGGCYRSGTSLVRRILDAHSRIYCGPEIKFFRDFYSDYFFDPLQSVHYVPSARSVLPDSDLLKLLGTAFIALHERAAALAGKVRWADKAPENVIYLGAWEQLLGSNWVFVHVVRNPFDTLASIKEAKFPDAIPSNLDGRIALYNRFSQEGLRFGASHPDRYYRIVYEELSTHPEVVIPKFMEWLGEVCEPMQLHFNRAPHQHGLEDAKIKASDRVHDRSVGRWKKLLTSEEAHAIAAGCGSSWGEMVPGQAWMPSEAELDLASGMNLDREAADGLPSTLDLSQISESLARARFELESERAAMNAWTKELLEQIALRDQQLSRIKEFPPVRVALAIRRLVMKVRPESAAEREHE